MNRRTVLYTISMGLLAGCTGSTEEPKNNLKTEEIAQEEFPIYNTNITTQSDLTNSTSLISENPSANEIFVAHIAQLPNPGHQLQVDTTFDNKKGDITVTYSSTAPSNSDMNQPTVIQPTPHAIRISLPELPSDLTITLKTITGDELTYTTQNQKRTATLSRSG